MLSDEFFEQSELNAQQNNGKSRIFEAKSSFTYGDFAAFEC